MKEQFGFYDHYEAVPKQVYATEDGGQDSMLPGKIIVHPTSEKYATENQLVNVTNYTIARTSKGRIFQSYFSSTEHADENVGNWCMVISSDDEGKTFQNCFVIEPPNEKTTRTFDLNLWIDEDERLWAFWSQACGPNDGRLGVWVSCCDNPDDAELRFTAPRRISNGVMGSQPIITRNGEWILAVSLYDAKWAHGSQKIVQTLKNWIPQDLGISIYSSKNKGETFERIAAQIRFPYSTFEEPSIVERGDGSFMMWIRGKNCTAQSFSYDGGHTWTTPIQNIKMNLPDTHFYLGKLKSGNLLLLANYQADMFSYYGGRNNLKALISRDDGETWEGFLMIDEREGSSQPNFAEGDNGFIYITYSRAPQIAAETLLAIVTEEDIFAGKLINPNSKLRVIAHKSTGMRKPGTAGAQWVEQVAKEHNIDL